MTINLERIKWFLGFMTDEENFQKQLSKHTLSISGSETYILVEVLRNLYKKEWIDSVEFFYSITLNWTPKERIEFLLLFLPIVEAYDKKRADLCIKEIKILENQLPDYNEDHLINDLLVDKLWRMLESSGPLDLKNNQTLAIYKKLVVDKKHIAESVLSYLQRRDRDTYLEKNRTWPKQNLEDVVTFLLEWE
jgi:hypothetical protein